MWKGRPVVASAVGGIRDQVEDGVSGWLCEPGDLGALTELLRTAATAGIDQLAAMGRAARERIESHHRASGFVDHVASRLQAWVDEPSRT